MPILLLFVVLIEGFTTLAMQMVALRQAIPLVGSSVILTSVVIGVILLALAVGYWNGGRLTARLSHEKITKVLSWMLFGAGLYYVFLVFPLQQKVLVDLVQQMPYVSALFVFSVMFFFLPVAAASHTMPMITELTTGSKGFAAGKILFVSTIGSFLGSILTSTVLFGSRGVVVTGYATAGMLILCHMALIIYQKRVPWAGIVALIFVGVLFIQRPETEAMLYSYDSPYQQIQIREDKLESTTIRTMLLNGGFASSIDVNNSQSWFGYIRSAIEATDMRTAVSSVSAKKKALVIGAAGFTYPEEIAQREYIERIDTIDVDPAVKEIAEKYFQQKPLHEKINFIPESARGFMHDAILEKTFYDYILVDAYIGTSIPDELVTKEFFEDLSKLGSHIMLNMITDTKMETNFALSLMSTLQTAWPDGVRYKNVSDNPEQRQMSNFLITSRPFAGAEKYETKNNAAIYTDNKHSIEVDKAAMFYQ